MIGSAELRDGAPHHLARSKGIFPDGVTNSHQWLVILVKQHVPGSQNLAQCTGFVTFVGWCSVVPDTTDNLPSANNFIRAGYRLYRPQHPWAGGLPAR